MKFKFTHDADVPVEYLFGRAADFERAEMLAQQRGITIRRTDSLPNIAVGSAWAVTAKIRRRPREFKFDLLEFHEPEAFVVDISTAIFTTRVRVDCVGLSQDSSRLAMAVETKPLNLRGRLLVQSLKLARNRIKTRVDQALFKFTKNIEHDFRQRS